jgi:hypothetical protein
MSTSGLRVHGRDDAPQRPWQAPVLSVLVFRATANGSSPGTDTQFPDMIPTASPPAAPPPPPPPPNAKGNFACDGTVQTGAGTTATFVTNASKSGGTNQDAVFQAHPNQTLAPCANLNFTFT